MPPKRKKKAAPKGSSTPAAAKASANATTSSSNETPSPIASLLINVQVIAQDKTRCAELLQAFSSGKCGVLVDEGSVKNKDEHEDCYWVLLATHFLEKRVQSNDVNVAVVLASLSHSLATILYSDKAKLDRCAANVGGAEAQKATKSALGRAILSITMASMTALQTLITTTTSSDLEEMPSIHRKAIWAAVTALEMTVHHAVTKVTPSNSDGWNHAMHWLLHDASSLDEEEKFVEILKAASRAFKISMEEYACLAALLDEDKAPTMIPTTANNKRRRAAASRNDETQSLLTTSFLVLITPSAVVLDGRVSIRRWAAMTLVWFCQGQQRILEFCNTILTDSEQWSANLDCPAVNGLKATPSSSSSKKSTRKRGTQDQEDSNSDVVCKTTPPPVTIPGNVAMVALVSRLLNVISASGTNCGVRAPTGGGLDTYATLVLGLTSTGGRGGRGGGASDLTTWTRADLRDLASVVIYKLIQAHAFCLESNCVVSDDDQRWVLVNDESDGFAASVPNTVARPLKARFYPTVHRSLDSLCHAAAATGVTSSRVLDSLKALQGILTAFVLASGGDYNETHIVDAKLYGFAISNLSSCVRSLVEGDDQSSSSGGGGAISMEVDESDEAREERRAQVITEYGLDVPVPIPSMAPSSSPEKASRKKNKKRSETTQGTPVCTFGGVFPQVADVTQAISDEQILTLSIRAMGNEGTSLYSELIEIVRLCYDMQEPNIENANVPEAETKRSGKRRAASSKASQGKKKRRKVAGGEAEIAADDDANTTLRAKEPRSMKSTRSGLATDALTTMRLIVEQIPSTSSASTAHRDLRDFLRETMSTDHVCGVVELNELIGYVLMEASTAWLAKKKAPGESGNAILDTHCGDYFHYERQLWTAHVNLCKTIGRGEPSHDPNKRATRPILRGCDERLKIFYAVAAASGRTRSSSNKTAPHDRWPLYLPAAQHALVATNLVSEPTPFGSNSSPEKYIAYSCMASIIDALNSPEIVTCSEWPKAYTKGSGEAESVVVQNDVPLALRDARLFVLAASRLPHEQQVVFLNDFTRAVGLAVENLRTVESRSSVVSENSEVSGFVARVITVCSTLMNVVAVGPKLRDALSQQVGSTLYHIPSFVGREDVVPRKRLKDGDWYNSASSFVGLFVDWESPTIPDVSGPIALRTIPDETVSNIRSLNESGIQLGFRSARRDRCHLLFASWNASGRSASWEKTQTRARHGDSIVVDDEGCARLLLEIRDDMCNVHREIHGTEGSFPQSILTRVLQQRGGNRRSSGLVKSRLDGLMTKAEAITSAILNSGQIEQISSASLALLEAVSAYIAFIVASHTRTTRPILSDEGSTASDADGNDERLGALMELNDSCVTFGAAPTHPDWLDDSCYLRDSMAGPDAVRIAHRAMVCLQKICSVATSQYAATSLQMMSSWVQGDDNGDERAALALRLSLVRLGDAQYGEESHSEGECTSKQIRWAKLVASFCGVDERAVKLFTEEPSCPNTSHAHETFCKSAAQRIFGKLQEQLASIEDWEPSLAEYRACGEWELLLAEALIGSCADLDLTDLIDSNTSGEEPGWKHAWVRAARWARVLNSGVSHLMPAAALLRFGISGGLGRKSHPLSGRDLGSDAGDGLVGNGLRINEPLKVTITPPRHVQINGDIMTTLSFLARIAVGTEHEEIERTCAAVASNLMIDSRGYSDLESMEALRFSFVNLFQIRDAVTNRSGDGQDGTYELSVKYLTEQLISCIETFGTSSGSTDKAASPLTRLFSFLGGDVSLPMDTLLRSGLDHTVILSSATRQSGIKTLRDDGELEEIQARAISEMVGTLLQQEGLSALTCSRVCRILSSLAQLDAERPAAPGQRKGAAGLLLRMTTALNEQNGQQLRRLINWGVCQPDVDPRPADEVLTKISADLCTFLSFVVGTSSSSPQQRVGFEGGPAILDCLLGIMDQWLVSSKLRGHSPIVVLLSLLGARYSGLHTIGSRLVSGINKATEVERGNYLKSIRTFFCFVHRLEMSLSGSNEMVALEASSQRHSAENEVDSFHESKQTHSALHGRPLGATVVDVSVPRTCSFILRSGFHAQHWYNCYTCGLVWDKGCCTLCALTCHQGHDVAYSRYSSFFCDCGGEAPTEDENRAPCKCLTSIKVNDAQTIFEGEKWSVLDRATEESGQERPGDSDLPCAISEDENLFKNAVCMASTHLENFSRSALEELKQVAVSGSWATPFFNYLRSHQRLGNCKDNSQLLSDDLAGNETSTEQPDAELSIDKANAPRLFGRNGKTLDLQRLGRRALIPLRSFRAGSFKLGLAGDTTSDHVIRTMLSKSSISRRALVADCRGRMIVAEPLSLLFCSVLPSVNVKYEEDAAEVPCGRGQMSVLGSASVKFNVVGMDLCPENERHLVIWGTAYASIVILNDCCDRVERTVELAIELEPDESEIDYLVKCSWIPGSQTVLMVACGPFVRFFDLRLAEQEKANSIASYSLAYESALRDVALVPLPSASVPSQRATAPFADKVRVFLLLEIGSFITFDLNFDESRQLKEQGEMYIESGDGISFPIGGVRLNHSTHTASSNSRTRSLGEGSSLVFLPKSGVLLYSCLSSSVVALFLDKVGGITGSFELLPCIIKGDVLGTGYDINGPFRHWTELGVVEVDGATFFRSVCVGKSSRTSHPKMLCVEYNQDAVKVKEMAWSGSSSLSLTSSLDGVAAFSAPALSPTSDASGRLQSSDFAERVCVCAVASNGAMLIFGEDLADLFDLSAQSKPVTQSGPSFPLTVFENLRNVGDADGLTFGGDRIGSESAGVKTKLSSKNSTYFMCPSRDGCTITVKLTRDFVLNGVTLSSPSEKSGQITKGCDGDNHSCDISRDEVVVVALRLLVGTTTTEFIPKYVSLEGRRVWLQPDKKKWYDLPLTAEEIALGLRNGFVSLGIGPSFDPGNNPLLDAVEVYGARRGQIRHWLPLTTLKAPSATVADEAGETAALVKKSTRDPLLASCVSSLTNMLQVLGMKYDAASEGQRIVRQLIQATVLDEDEEMRHALTSLFCCIEPNSDERHRFLDEASLSGVAEALIWTKDELGALCAGSNEPHRDVWDRARRRTRQCLKLSTEIARKRPENYKSSVQKIVMGRSASKSIAAISHEILTEAFKEMLDCVELVPDFVVLCLTEMLLFRLSSEAMKLQFATLDDLAVLLKSPDEDLVTACCESILSYWSHHLSVKNDPIQYQCDSCCRFPIKEKRYNLAEGDIDLCSECYLVGQGFANTNPGYAEVKIRGQTVGGKSPRLTCARLLEMKPKPIFEVHATDSSELANYFSSPSKDASVDVLLEEGSSLVFDHLLKQLLALLASTEFDVKASIIRLLMDLVVNMTKKSGHEELVVRRAKQFAEVISERASVFIRRIGIDDVHEVAAREVLTICIQGLSSLALSKNDSVGRTTALSSIDDCSVEDASPAKKEKTDPRFVCEAHGVSAVRRRCSHGLHKNRRFYVCGMERDSRCKYFKWADLDDTSQSALFENATSELTSDVERVVWNVLKIPCGADSRPLHFYLCKLLETDAHDQDTGALTLPAESTNCHAISGTTNEISSSSFLESSSYCKSTAALDYIDGVFCSQEKLRVFSGQWLLEESSNGVEAGVANQREVPLIKATLDLLSQVAGTAEKERGDNDESTRWFSLLCEIISSTQSSHYRALAKRVLKRLCGGNKATYYGVRDHYVFAFQFRQLLLDAQTPLLAALNVKEQARQCGTHWRTGTTFNFGELAVGGLIGTNYLVSEDCLTVAVTSKIGATLDELTRVAKNRCVNWRNFCTLTSLPQNYRTRLAAARTTIPAEDPDLESAPPVVTLMWMACFLSGENQIEVLRLIGFALSAKTEAQATDAAVSTVARDKGTSSRNTVDDTSSDGGMDTDVGDIGAMISGASTRIVRPETVLIEGKKALRIKELHAFVVQFVLHGESPDAQKVGREVAFKLYQKFPSCEAEWLFRELTDRALHELVDLGCSCAQLLRLLQLMTSCDAIKSSPTLIDVSRRVVDAFTTQMRMLYQAATGGLGGEVSKDANAETSSREAFDLTNCVHCHCEQVAVGSLETTVTSTESSTRGSSSRVPARGVENSSSIGHNQTVPFLRKQVRPFSRASLDASTDVSLSSEFSTFVQLKCRVALSDIHLSIGDPRGRYVKTINVYFSPRQVSDANCLKTEEYADLWQLCATLSLSRGATRANVSLAVPVVAANLRIEYIEFYERPGGSRAEDGSLLLHCPRCARVVNNAHGVCAHCGEVAFQCRKCRHINYDRLDAFLCVECGYCSAGTFSYELTSGAASNAVAIVDDESHERTLKMLRGATRLHEELRSTLSDRVRPVAGKRSLSAQKFGPGLKRTFAGELPKLSKDSTEEGGSSSRRFRSSAAGSFQSDGRGEDGAGSSASSRSQSLLRLARHLRNESSADRPSRAGRDFVLRQALLGASRDIDDMDSDMIGFISAADLDRSDPLSRLVASIQGRVRSRAAAGEGGDGSNMARSGGDNDNAQSGPRQSSTSATKVSPEECKRLHQLMREAERERFELQRRVDAWKRLENDALADFGSAESMPTPFSPCLCSKCRGPIALKLLVLCMQVFLANPDMVQETITEKFVCALFDEQPDLEQDLLNAKRKAIVDLAIKSEQASKVVLEILRLRLKAFRDPASADILGKIIAFEHSSEAFVNLANEILGSG